MSNKRRPLQMNEAYFESLNHEILIKVASNLLDFGINLMEQLETTFHR